MASPGVNLEPYYTIIEQVIAGIGITPTECRVKDKDGKELPGQWDLKKGSASVYVDVYTTQDGGSYVCVASPVMKIATSKLQGLYEKLLLLNHQMYAVSYSINQGWVWLRGLRECEGMDTNECRAMFDRVGWYGDHYDDELKSEFGG